MGYRRPDGRVGIRNHVLILPTSICASDTTERIANAVEGCVSFHNQNGCSQVDCDQKVTIAALAGYAANPNIYGVVCVSLGCEGCQNDIVVDAIRERTNKPVETLVIQRSAAPSGRSRRVRALPARWSPRRTGASASPLTSPSSSSAPTAAAPTPRAALAPIR
ncbi:MAG: UxaA family hydrolase [Collinsella sp.]